MAVFNKEKKVFAFVDKESEAKDSFLENKSDKFIEEAVGKSRVKSTSGRKKIKNEDKNNCYVMVYMTQEQKAELESEAKKKNLSISKYVNLRLFGF